MLVRRSLTALAALVLVSTAACGSDGEGGDSSTAGGETLAGVSVTGDFGEEPKIKIDDLDVKKAESAELIEGDGAEVTKDSYLDYQLVVVNASSGDVLQSSYEQPEPIQMVVAQQSPLVTDALVGTKIGSRVAVAAPVEEIVGEGGAAQVGMTAEDDVVLVYDLVEEGEAPLEGPEGKEVDPPADAPKVLGDDEGVTGIDFSDAPAKAPKKLEVIPLIEGEGPEVKEGDNVTVDYYGAVWGADEPFDESYSRGTPASFGLTPGGLIEGWVKGLQGVKVGSRVMLVIPPEQGYGPQGSGEAIPGNSTLVFVIDVLGN